MNNENSLLLVLGNQFFEKGVTGPVVRDCIYKDYLFFVKESFKLSPILSKMEISYSFELGRIDLLRELKKRDTPHAENLCSDSSLCALFKLHLDKIYMFLYEFNGVGHNYPKLAEFMITYCGSIFGDRYGI